MHAHSHTHDQHDEHGSGRHAHHTHHGHDHHGHSHAPPDDRRILFLALALTLGFAGVEAVAGLVSGSLALLGDAGHMVTDSMALALAAFAAVIARRPPTQRLSYGFNRAEAVAGLTNGLFMMALIGWLLWQSVHRLLAPVAVSGDTVTVVALVGLVINLVVAWLLSRGEQNLNTRGALLHVMGDLLGSVAALASGLVITYTGWTPIDPLLTMLIAGLILGSTLNLLRSAVRTLMEGVPPGISLPDVGRRLAHEPGVLAVHDLHIWSLDSKRVALSAHVVLRKLDTWPTLLGRLQNVLEEEFSIGHATLQPELVPDVPVAITARAAHPPAQVAPPNAD